MIIHTSDVKRFYRIYDAADGRPTAAQLQRDYLDQGSEGLLTFAKARNVTGVRMAETLAERPEIYSDARRCVQVLPHVRRRLKASLQRLGKLYPPAKFPSVTIVIGRGKPVGIGSPAKGVQIGLEALCAINYLNPDIENRFVFVIAHEFVHVQQTQALVDDDQPTVLEASVVEGAAEFIGELTSGGVAYAYLKDFTKGREKEVETQFSLDEGKTDLSDWLNNGTSEQPGDLGYWVGYRIAKSYYDHAADKKQAIRDIVEIKDPKQFLTQSGWYPGIALR